jgi:hypothetical protein
LPGLVATIILFLYRISNWHITNSINFYPDALGQETFFIFVYQGMLKWEKGTIITMVMDPTADNINLIDLSFANNTGWFSKQASLLQ